MKKTIAALAVLSTSATALAAEPVQISWWHGMGGANEQVINQVAQKFNTAQTACAITPVSKGTYEEALASGIAAFRSKEQPNILQVFDAGAATIINAKGATIPAEDILTQNGYKLDRDAFINGVRYFYADASGKFIGMPFNSSAPIMYINTEALQKAGVSAPKTWDDFEKIAPKLKDAGYIGLSASQLTWMFFENFFSRNNVQMASNANGYDSFQGTTLNAENPELIAMFKKLKDWHDKGWFGYYGAGWSDNQKPFEEGKVALWIGSSGSFGGLSKTASMPFSADFLPYDAAAKDGNKSTFIGGAALFAMSGHPAAENKCTADFFNFLTTTDIQKFYHEQTGYVAITKAAYEAAKADGWYEQHPQAEVGIKQLMLPQGEWSKGYRLGFYPQIRVIEEREFNKIFAGETSVEDAFKAIETEGNELLAKFAKTSG
ncbi:extracellular solute-binding protein [Paenirhodobacter enshiensis]|uniref:sn-glycerol-3-phosphate-binding periplasmic protein UgpB n=1 Tax=Paenirhodobacter enshiensis TaxID=1105367 RepID=A0A086XUZ8_9RHOB|nr:extracellular solute-binding protein [Paenirhodobacter enshiensis]KFI25848.1 glycerol 3-phosphate ABC transporter substrate-binding protein [Paenirhodobacter enshiensis]